jgi:hypothetical protein
LQISERKLPVTVTGEEKTHADEAKDSPTFLMLKELEKEGLYKSRWELEVRIVLYKPKILRNWDNA